MPTWHASRLCTWLFLCAGLTALRWAGSLTVLPPLRAPHRSIRPHHRGGCSPSAATARGARRRATTGAMPRLVGDSDGGGGSLEEEREERRDGPDVYWCPVRQVYLGGVPGTAAIDGLLDRGRGRLRIFGYGSLCWQPGAGALADPAVTRSMGRVRGYRRCWAQRSTDHRGTTAFPGLVCTLLTDDEYRLLWRDVPVMRLGDRREASLTEGAIYTVPPHLVNACLSELDFREKGGYSRDIIAVTEDGTEETVECLLYRGTPENPAFWPRALRSLPFAAAVISSAVGPSGPNEVYLNQLDLFLESAATDHAALEKSDDTFLLARMEQAFRRNYDRFFFVGCGSNQHNQLLLRGITSSADLVGENDAHVLTESVLFVPAAGARPDPIVDIVAGAGHTGAISSRGCLYLFGWNDSQQLGTCRGTENEHGVTIISSLQHLNIAKASLGFSHTLVITTDGRFYAFGDNSRGQVTGVPGCNVQEPYTPAFLTEDKVVDISAGLYHSAVITDSGDLITYGCNRHDQCFQNNKNTTIKRWRPSDGASALKVACGKYHTVVVDSLGRVWSFGDNRFGQLGRSIGEIRQDPGPGLVESPEGLEFNDVSCGWSHVVAMAKNQLGEVVVYGWGRSDKGQLASTNPIEKPNRLFCHLSPVQLTCGSESTVIVDDKDIIWCCGWNEHGNLATGDDTVVDRHELAPAVGASVITTPEYRRTRLKVAAGGAHLVAARIVCKDEIE